MKNINQIKLNELLGTAGTGKTTVRNTLLKQYPNLVFSLDNLSINLFLIKYIHIYILIFIKGKNFKILKSLIAIHILLYNIDKNLYKEDTKFIFDHGPIFIISQLIFEIPLMENLFLKELIRILKYYDEVIYLQAPSDILCLRINEREENHRIKDKSQNSQKDFLNKYTDIFTKIIKICKENNINVTIIDTNKNSITEVGELVIERFKK
jgi:adenylate kinase family enzyme